MATNYFIKFENDTSVPSTSYNTIEDANFTSTEKIITKQAVAFSNILNGVLRQTTLASHTLAEFIKEKTGEDVKSDKGASGAEKMSVSRFITALDNTIDPKIDALDEEIPFKKSNSLNSVLNIWHGTEAQYDAIAEKDPNTLYFVY
jgi:flagellar biosynthesis chaperone FliJ